MLYPSRNPEEGNHPHQYKLAAALVDSRRNRTFGAVVLVLGAGLLNFVYLWDIMLRKPSGIILGPWSGLAIVITNIAIVAGLIMMIVHRPPPKEAGPGEEAEK